MADQVQLIAQIRFAIEQLSERNAQHEWEHLCRHLARARICSNLLPATGPVQAGGDQGRDFETFQTFLAKSTLKGHSFVGLISDVPLAFACTLEKQTPSKIRKDVETIMSSGTTIKGIYTFCSRDLPVAKQHELKEWASKTYAVNLEILDAAAISELLGDREIFWIAARYLQIPGEIFPALPTAEKNDWYSQSLHKWQSETGIAQSFADFAEIRAAARHALGAFVYDEDGRPIIQHERPELPFWIERFDEIANHTTIRLLGRRALYESSVLRLRGLGSLIGQEERLRLYFAEIPQLHDANDLEDVSVLLTYMLTANKLSHVKLADSEIEAWHTALEQQVDTRIRDAKKLDRVNERCALLEVRGHIAIFRQHAQGILNVSECLNCWRKLAKLADRAPLFPVERFADRLSKYALFLGSHPEYESLTKTVDALLAKRFGAFKCAEKCLERAKVFQESNDLPRAMAQVHQAKIDWFAEETLEKSLFALRWLSHAYEEQGLNFAAKYYSLICSYVALHANDLRLKSLIARSLQRVAEIDYKIGAWHGYFEFSEAAAIFYPEFADDPTADFNNPEGVLQHLIYYLTLASIITRRFYPTFEHFAQEKKDNVLERLNLCDIAKEMQPTAEATFGEMNAETFQKTIEEQLSGSPWSDAGDTRYTQWKTFGITWNIEWANNYETTLASEEFLATLQIFLSDLVGYDLCFLRSRVDATIQITSQNDYDASVGYKGFDIQFEPSNTQRKVIIKLPPYERFKDGSLTSDNINAGTLGIASSLLSEVSLLPSTSFHAILNERFSHGLSNKLLIGASYNQCFREFVSEEAFNNSQRKEKTFDPLPLSFISRVPEALAWNNNPGQSYSTESAHEQIENRYHGFTPPIAQTLQRLIHEQEFQSTVSSLRSSGWKDWHILSAVFHVAIHYRIKQLSIIVSNVKAENAIAERMAREPEPADAPIIPIQEFSKDKLRGTIPVYFLPCLKTYGLEIHQLTPDFEAIEDFLSHRYNFWTDDVEHEDPFKLMEP